MRWPTGILRCVNALLFEEKVPMDAPTFIVELVKATAWPATIVAVAILFRTEFRALLNRLRKGKLGPAEFEFEKAVRELEQDAAQILPRPQPVPVEPARVSLATSDPRAALISEWLEVERAISNLAQKHGLPTDQIGRRPLALLRELAKAGLVPQTHVPLFFELNRLRNQAVRERDFNPAPEAVLGYLQIAQELKELLATK